VRGASGIAGRDRSATGHTNRTQHPRPCSRDQRPQARPGPRPEPGSHTTATTRSTSPHRTQPNPADKRPQQPQPPQPKTLTQPGSRDPSAGRTDTNPALRDTNRAESHACARFTGTSGKSAGTSTRPSRRSRHPTHNTPTGAPARNQTRPDTMYHSHRPRCRQPRRRVHGAVSTPQSQQIVAVTCCVRFVSDPTACQVLSGNEVCQVDQRVAARGGPVRSRVSPKMD
jgi:hypothetical protein